MERSTATLEVGLLAYADDLAICAQSVEALNEAIDRIQRVGSSVGLSINSKKSKIIWLSCKPDEPEQVILEGQEIETVKKFTYLGGLISEPKPGGVTRPAVLRQVRQARFTLDGIAGVIRQKGLGVKGRELLVRSMVIPVLLQGAEN